MDAPYWVNYLIWILLILVAFIGLFFFNAWSLNRKVTDKKTGRQKIIAEIWGADGYPTRTLVPIDPNGRTVRINNIVYILNEKKKKESEADEGESKGRVPSPTIRYEKYPKSPFLGIGTQKVLRIESWGENNPMPITPPRGKFVTAKGDLCDSDVEGAIFVPDRPAVSATELTALINEAHAAAASTETEELEAQRKTFLNAFKNLPSKTMLYMLVGGNLLLTVIAVVMIWSSTQA
jgi:hypothetical protein